MESNNIKWFHAGTGEIIPLLNHLHSKHEGLCLSPGTCIKMIPGLVSHICNPSTRNLWDTVESLADSLSSRPVETISNKITIIKKDTPQPQPHELAHECLHTDTHTNVLWHNSCSWLRSLSCSCYPSNREIPWLETHLSLEGSLVWSQ